MRIIIDKKAPAPVVQEEEQEEFYGEYNGPPETEAEFEAMVREASSESEGTFILIAAIVVLFVMAALLFTKLVLKSNHENMVEESIARKKKLSTYELQRLKA